MTKKAIQDSRTLRDKLGYLSDDQVAALMGIGLPTFRNRRSKGDAPPSAKVGGKHLTTVEDLRRWIARRKAAA